MRSSNGAHTEIDHLAVTVIMPVYNSRDYVKAAVQSVLAQEFDGFELLAIDDGSTDGSGALLDAMAFDDSRIRVIHKDNGGMCSARNLGILEARGEYVTFCDNDDECLPGFIVDNYAIAKAFDADCVRFGRALQRIDALGRLTRETIDRPSAEGVFSASDFVEHPEFFLYGSGGVWTGLYRRSMLVNNGIAFDERLKHGLEDILFNANVYKYSSRIVLSKGIYYCWKRREGHSASMSVADDKLLGLSLVLEAEDYLFERASSYEIHPSFCAQRIVGHTKDLISASCYASSRSFDQEVELYREIRHVLLPYESKIVAQPIDAELLVIRECLLKERYPLLYSYIALGVAVKKAIAALQCRVRVHHHV